MKNPWWVTLARLLLVLIAAIFGVLDFLFPYSQRVESVPFLTLITIGTIVYLAHHIEKRSRQHLSDKRAG